MKKVSEKTPPANFKGSVLFFFIGHRQLEEYKLQSFFLRRFKKLKNFDVMIYCNSNFQLEQLQSYCEGIPNIKDFFVHQRNGGYVTGLFLGLADHFDKFKEYDYVVHLHPDVFIYDDFDLYENIRIMDWMNFDILASPSLHGMKYDVDGLGHGSVTGWFDGDPVTNQNCFHATDFFIFKPSSIDVNFFDTNFNGEAEHIFTHNIQRYNLKVLYLNRPSKVIPDLFFTKDSCGIWHSHNLEIIREHFQIN